MKARYLNVVPLVGFAALFAYACYAAAVLGHWPYPSFNDPKDLPAGSLTNEVLLVALAGFALVVVMPIAYLLFRILARWQKWQLPEQKGAFVWYSMGAAPWLLDIVVANVSRYSLLSWILD